MRGKKPEALAQAARAAAAEQRLAVGQAVIAQVVRERAVELLGTRERIRQLDKQLAMRRPAGGNRRLKRVFYQSAICALNHDPTSKTFYPGKRSEDKTHRQAVIALARRRVNVLQAMLRGRTSYQVGHAAAAA